MAFITLEIQQKKRFYLLRRTFFGTNDAQGFVLSTVLPMSLLEATNPPTAASQPIWISTTPIHVRNQG
jgi:hypothetical protein